MTQSVKVGDGHVVAMHYTLHVEGELIDASQNAEPLQFIQGMGHIIPGLEQQLYDMQIGESKKVTVAARDGYGELDAQAFMDVPRNAFRADIPLEIGMQLELKDKSGHPVHARIDALTEQSVRLNMNHPLAGKQLEFEVTIAGLRAATDEEVSHGHVHTHGHS